ncbi:Hypothetical predicted protein [Podarcis lilfordi]|uniref:Uncharacterized protein n=1 Tax=Podarcis lilfordi TaxID=74358 RepID=A0AA35NWB4_9SAUR|nr:Hypothetical predicted protein [Podarcis lilfordi]
MGSFSFQNTQISNFRNTGMSSIHERIHQLGSPPPHTLTYYQQSQFCKCICVAKLLPTTHAKEVELVQRNYAKEQKSLRKTLKGAKPTQTAQCGPSIFCNHGMLMEQNVWASARE